MPAKRNIGKKKRSIGRTDLPIEITLPSIDPDTNEHNVCLARRPGPQGLVRMGILDNLDSLTALVSEEHLSDTNVNVKAVKKMAESSGDMRRALDLMDRVLVACLVDPVVQMDPEQDGDREPDVLYASEVDFEDKAFLLQWVMGGTADWERFREESGELMGRLETKPGVRVSS